MNEKKYKTITIFSILINVLLIGGFFIYQKLSTSEQQYVLIKTNYDQSEIYRYNITSIPDRRSADLLTGHKAYSYGYGIYRIIVYELETDFVLLDLNIIVSERYTEINLVIKNNKVVGITA